MGQSQGHSRHPSAVSPRDSLDAHPLKRSYSSTRQSRGSAPPRILRRTLSTLPRPSVDDWNTFQAYLKAEEKRLHYADFVENLKADKAHASSDLGFGQCSDWLVDANAEMERFADISGSVEQQLHESHRALLPLADMSAVREQLSACSKALYTM